VRLYLPRAGKSSSAAVLAEDADIPVAANQTVLIVEDDEAVRRAAVHQLKELGYKVLEAQDARAARDILQRERVDLLFSDVTMPGGISGPDLAREATSNDPQLKVLLTSGFTEWSMRQREAAEKFSLLSKPYRRQELARSVHRALCG
jgi:DNA-binding NtrC family response regulator